MSGKLQQINQRFLILFIGLFGLFIGILALIGYIDRQQMMQYSHSIQSERKKLLNSTLELMRRPFELFVYDYSFWDEMLSFVRKPEPQWAHTNIEAALPNFQVQCVWIFNHNHDMVYYTGPSLLKKIPLPDTALHYLCGKKYFSHFFVWQDSLLIEIAGAPIQPSSDNQRLSSPQGALFAGRLWDENRILELARINNCTIWIRKEFSSDTNFAIEQAMHIYQSLYGWDSSMVAQLHCVSSNTAFDQFRYITRFQWLVLIFIGLISFITIIYHIRRWVIRPVMALTEALRMNDAQVLDQTAMLTQDFYRLSDLVRQFFYQRDQLAEECRVRADAEVALKRSEQEYRYLFDFALDALMLVDPDKQLIVRVNQSWQRLYLFQEGEEPNYPLENLWLETESFEKMLDMVQRHGEVLQYDARHRNAAGEELAVSINARTVHYRGKPVILCTCQDVSEQQRVEKLLLSHNILLRVRNLVLVSNSQGHIIYANHAVKDILGYESQEVLGDQWWKLTREGQEAEEEKHRIRSAATHPEQVSSTPYERWIRDKWGNNHCIIWSDAPAPGNLIIGVGYDITDRIQTQRALEASEQRYRFLFDHIPFPMLMSQANTHTVVAINQTARQLFGMEASDEERLRISEWIAQVPSELDNSTDIRSYRRPDGTLIEIELQRYDFELLQQPYSLYLLKNRSAEEEAEKATLRYQEQKIRLSGVIEALEDERRRMAYELHDGLGQILSGAKRLLEHFACEVKCSPESAEQIDQIVKMLNNALAETKTIAYNLLPRTLEEYGLYFAVEQLMRQWLPPAGIQFHFHRHDVPKRLPYYMELALYRIVQEALNNVIKHAKATEVSVQFVGYPLILLLTIEDNGIGFDPSQPSAGIGLRSMKDRVAYLDGNLHIDSGTGKGTNLIIEIPKREEL